MKTLFIYPNAGSQLGFNYGVAHISSVLKAAGHQVELLQLCEDIAPLPSDEEFAGFLRKSAPDIIGFSVVTNQWPYTERLAKIARKTVDSVLVCGGVHATVATEETVGSGLFDHVFVGECDEAFLDFVEKLGRGEDVGRVRNTSHLSPEGRVCANPVRPLPSLSTLPMKDYSVFDFQKMIDAKKGWVGLMASRGCPFSCTYCFNHKMVKKYRSDLGCSFRDLNYIRQFPVETVIGEIKYLLENYKRIEMFIFDDDLFTYDKDYIVEFCGEYKKVSRLPFVVNGHVGFFDEDRAKALASANCAIVKFGLESGSPRIRSKIMNRHMGNENIEEAIGIVNRHGMHSSVFVMIGLPHETEDDLMQTVRLLAKSRPGRFRWTYFFPYPGTESYKIAMDSGFVNERKMRELVNFTDETCLEFGEKQDLLLRKIGVLMPWFVNAESSLECAEHYKSRLDEMLRMDKSQWKKIEPIVRDEDKRLSAEMQKKNLSHYAVKYNRFMGVISDYFMREA